MKLSRIILFAGIAATALVTALVWSSQAAQALFTDHIQPEVMAGRLSGVVAFDPSLANLSGPGAGTIDLEPTSLFNRLLQVPLGPNVLANQDNTLQQQNEPSIVVNPHNPLHVIASSNDYRLVAQGGDVRPGYYVSFDGGVTWPGDGVIDLSPLPGVGAGGDPALAIYDENNVYFAYIAFNRSDDEPGGVYVSKSTDGGLTWGDPVEVADNTLTEFQDKEYIAVDATGGSHDGNVYMSWTRFAFNYPIFFSRSTDGGSTFSPPIQISNDVATQGSIPAVGPNGEVYVVWYSYQYSTQRMAVSTNGGQSFGPPFNVANVDEIPSPLPGGSFRDNSFPTLGVDQNTGDLYVAWSDYSNGDADIFFVRSTDGGQNWSDPIRVNDDLLFNDLHQFFPWLAVAPNGNIYLSWFDSRNDPTPYSQPFIYDEYAAVSTDGGLSFSENVRISEVSSDASIGFGGGFIGDYSGLAATDQFIFPAWVDTRRGHQDIFTQSVLPVTGDKVAPVLVERGEVFTYTIAISSSQILTDNLLVDPLPSEVSYVPDTLWASSGSYSAADQVISWQGDISPTQAVTISFQVTTTGYCSFPIANTAVLTDGLYAVEYPFSATSLISGSLPVAAFTPSNLAPRVNEVVTFTNASSGGDPLTASWDFGDGVTSTVESPQHAFAQAGSYTVTLTAEDACGAASAQQALRVCDVLLPSFSWTGGELVYTFTNQTTGTLPIEFTWDFGDGFTSTESSPVHAYAVPGPYTVTLSAGDACGGASYTALIDAACAVPQVGFDWLSDALTVTFTNTSSGHFPLSFLWNFGDGLTSTLASPVHLFNASDLYTVTLTASDLCGVGSISSQVTASCPAPLAGFTWQNNGLSVDFTNNSLGTYPLSYTWDLGDGTTSIEITPSHKYATPGGYTVRLEASEACGVSEQTAWIIVGKPVYLPVLIR